MTSLSAAHFGYNHQDLVTACSMAMLLVPRSTERKVTADKKSLPGDCFDDLELVGRHRRRIQIKAHENSTRLLKLTDFTQTTISFRIDRAIRSVIDDQTPAQEYRLFTTCAGAHEDLLPFLSSANSEPTLFMGLQTVRFRLDIDKIWPEDGPCLWPHCDTFTREQFAIFIERFIIEVGCPSSTGDLRSPGPLEKLLHALLHDQIGVGIWPNHNHDISDTAAHLLHAAKIGRQTNVTFEQNDVVAVLGLVINFGRVDERFPIDERTFVTRTSDVDKILATLQAHSRLIVTGPPGCGKSWLLTELASRLTSNGWVTGVHYCFIDILDLERSRRASIDTTFGSIMAELYDADPSLVTSSVPRYAAGPQELETLLTEAVRERPDRRIAIIIDGLDHADRIPERSSIQLGIEIAEELNALNLPPHVALIIGTQPGNHLNPLASFHRFRLSAWPSADIRILVERMGLAQALGQVGLATEAHRVSEAIVNKAQGSPLYASYLIRTAVAVIHSEGSTSSVVDVAEYVSSVPTFDEDLNRYYEWLVNGLGNDSGALWIAELLSLLDFSVSPSELCEIRKDFRHHVPVVLSRLAPVLIEEVTRGGVRIHHESFQRYMIERLKDKSAELILIKDLLTPVIQWLESYGLFADLRAFRSLLTLTARVGRKDEVIKRVDNDFVVQSAIHCQPADAVSANIALAGTCAASRMDWTALARLNEISRAADHLYYWRADDHDLLEEYGRAFAALYGVQALAERLLHDRRCTFPPRPGLILCKLCDEQYAIPSWKEYLSAHDHQRRTSSVAYSRANNTAIALARAQGHFRLSGRDKSVIDCTNWLTSSEGDPPHPCDSAMLLCLMYGSDALLEVIEALPAGENRAWARLTLARFHNGSPEAKAQATAAIREGIPVEGIPACLRAGADHNMLSRDVAKLHDLTIQVISPGIEFKDKSFSQWLAELELASVAADDQSLAAIQGCIPSDTWYRRWLRFRVTLLRPTTTQDQLAHALRELSSDIQIFAGKPRVCDLYQLHDHIRESFKEALSCLQEEHWPNALESLSAISKGTTSWLQGSRGGPLILNSLLELCLAASNTAEKRKAVSKMCERLFEPGQQTHELYDMHAEDQFLLTRIYAATGQNELAAKAWSEGCRYLAAYGHRKDITVYELLDPIKALSIADPVRVRQCFKAIQPVVERILAHTDGRETRGAIHKWLDEAARVHPAGALAYLAHETMPRGFSRGGLDHAIPKALVALKDQLTPVQLVAGWLGCGSEARSDPGAAILAAENLMVNDRQLGLSVWESVLCVLDGDGTTPVESLSEIVAASAMRVGVSPPTIRAATPTKKNEEISEIKRQKFSVQIPPSLPVNGTNFQIVHYMRGWHEGDETRPDANTLIDAIGWRLIERLECGNEASAESLLRRIAYDMSPWSGNMILGPLSEGLAVKGHHKIAAIASAFAYTRGNDGWHRFAGQEGELWFLKAIELNASSAWSVLAEEVADSIARGGSYGVTRHLIELLIAGGRIDDAFSAWDAACSVVVQRVPATGPQDEVEPLYDSDCNNDLEMLAATIVARINHCLIYEKRLAIAATALLVNYVPLALVAAIKIAVSCGAPNSTLTTLLHILKLLEPSPYDLSRSVAEELQVIATGQLVSVKILAAYLLNRAGLKVPLSAPSSPLVASITAERQTEIIRIIGTKRVQDVEQIWPNFGRYAAGRVNLALQSEDLRKRTQSFYRDIGRYSRKRPLAIWTPLDEELERAVQLTGGTVRVALAQEGIIDESNEIKVGSRLLGNLEISIRYCNSRIVRPSYLPMPNSLPSRSRSDIIAVENGRFTGWVVLGHRETELVVGESYPHPLRECIEVYSGVEFGCSDEPDLPLGGGSASIWTHDVEGGSIIKSFRGPLAGLAFDADQFGRIDLLSPHPAVLNGGVKTAPSHWGLILLDASGEPAVVGQSWRQKHIWDKSLEDEVPLFEGFQLLLRPDMFQAIRKLTVDSVSYTTVVTHKTTDETDD